MKPEGSIPHSQAGALSQSWRRSFLPIPIFEDSF